VKTLTNAVLAQLRKRETRAAILCELDLPGGAIERLWSGAGTLTWNGNPYYGLGKLGKISGAGETAEIRTTETTYQLSGIVDAEALNNFILNPVRNGVATAWLAFLDEDEQVIANPVIIDQSILDTAAVLEGEDGTSTLALRGTSDIFDMKRPRGRYVSNEQQQADYPGDTGMDRVPGLANRTVSWTRI